MKCDLCGIEISQDPEEANSVFGADENGNELVVFLCDDCMEDVEQATLYKAYLDLKEGSQCQQE